jgi:hypothetical protein
MNDTAFPLKAAVNGVQRCPERELDPGLCRIEFNCHLLRVDACGAGECDNPQGNDYDVLRSFFKHPHCRL